MTSVRLIALFALLVAMTLVFIGFLRGADGLELTAPDLEVEAGRIDGRRDAAQRAPAMDGYRILVEAGEGVVLDGTDVVIDFTGEDGAVVRRRLPLGREARLAIEPARYRVALADPGGLTLWPMRVRFPEIAPERALTLRVFAHRAVAVRTVSRTGDPIGGVPMTWRRTDRVVKKSYRTDDEGRADFVLPSGEYHVRVATREFSPDGQPLDRPYETVVTLGESGSEIEFVLEPVTYPVLRVEVDLLLDGRPIEKGRVLAFNVSWRGVDIRVFRQDDGRFVGNAQVRRAVADLPDRAPRAVIHGLGFRREKFAPPTSGIDGTTLRFGVDLVGYHDVLSGVYVDAAGRPMANAELPLKVRQGPTDGVFFRRDVCTDARGRFTVPGVSYPMAFYVDDQPLGERIVPRYPMPLRVDSPDEVTVRRELAHDVVLRMPDLDTARAVLASAKDGIVLDVLPLGTTPVQVRPIWRDGFRHLSDTALEQLGSGKAIHLGDLPAGRYRVTLFAPRVGTFSTTVTVDPAERRRDIMVRMTRGAPLAGRLVGPDLQGAVVVDGYLPTSIASTLVSGALFGISHLGDRPLAIARVDADGRFTMGVHNAGSTFVTAVLESGAIYHLRKDEIGNSGDVALAHDGDDRRISVRVLDPDGQPMADVAVNVTALRGGEGSGTTIWPRTDELRDLRTDRDGLRVLGGLADGAYILSVSRVESRGKGRRAFLVYPSSLQVIDVKGDRDLVVQVTELYEKEMGHGTGCACGHH